MVWTRHQKSYFDHFEEHAELIQQASLLLNDFFQQPSSSSQTAKEIKQLEHEADKVAHTTYNQLNSAGFILPIDREDILLFLKTLDDVIDYIDDVSAAFIDIYEMYETTSFAKKLTMGIAKGSKLLLENINLIRNPSKHSQQILNNCIEMHRLENEGDDIKKEALHQLYAELKANQINYADYIAWRDIYSLLEAVTDKIEDCANVAEQYVIKYS